MQAVRVILVLAVLLLASCQGRPPGWTFGPSEQYPPESFLTGVGFDADRARAEERARAEIAKIFEVQVRARDVSSESHWLARARGAAGEEYRQRVETEVTTVTDKALTGVRIAEVWQDERTGTYHALAVLDRLPAARALRSELEELDQRSAELVRQGEGEASALRRLDLYLTALRLLERRGNVAADLRIVETSGLVPDPPFAMADVAARADATAAAIRIGVDLGEDQGGIVRTALVRSLAELGLRLAPAEERDLTLRGVVGIEQYFVPPWQWVVASAQVDFVGTEGTVLDAVRVSVREGSQIPSRAETLARERLGERLAKLLLERLGKLGESR